MNIIEIEHLCHRFSDGTVGIDDISLTIPEGAFVLIAGENGSGKTTLLKHLNGLLLPETGSVRLAGESISKNLSKSRQMVGMVFQDPDSQIVGETVFDDIAFGPENLCLKRAEVDQRVFTAMKAVDLLHAADQSPHSLSGGEKRRLAIAGILAMNPRVVVFDEPFSSLDYPGVRQVLNQMISLQKSGHTLIVATHDLEKAMAHADRLVLMQAGKVVRDGLPSKIVKEVESFSVRAPCAFRLGMEIGSWLN